MLAPTQEPAVLNRAARRAQAKAARRQPVSKPRARFKNTAEAYTHLLKPMQLLSDCRPYEANEILGDLMKIEESYGRIQNGTATPKDADKVSIAINLAKLRALDIDHGLADMVEAGQDAMRRCLARYEEHKRLILDGPGMQDVRQALDIHEEILRNSTPKQMMDAMDTMRRLIFKQLEQSGKQSLLLNA
ncbi:hypothetical protein [Comamonas sp. C24C]